MLTKGFKGAWKFVHSAVTTVALYIILAFVFFTKKNACTQR